MSKKEVQINGFNGFGLTNEQMEAQRFTKRLLSWRKNNLAITKGTLTHYLPQNGVYVYFRKYNEEIVMVLINNNTSDAYVSSDRFYEILEEKASISLEPGTYTNRFVLAFKPNNTLSTNDEIVNLYTNISVDNKNHHLIVTKDYGIDIKKVELYNVLGETISTWKINEHADSYQLALKPELPAGIYISKITTKRGENNKKIVIE